MQFERSVWLRSGSDESTTPQANVSRDGCQLRNVDIDAGGAKLVALDYQRKALGQESRQSEY